MEGGSHLRRPMTGPFADRLSPSPQDKVTHRITNAQIPRNTSPRSSLLEGTGVQTNTANVTNSRAPNNSSGVYHKPSSSPPLSRVSSALSKFEIIDAVACKVSTLTGLKPVPRRTPTTSLSQNTALDSDTSSTLSSSNSLASTQGNKFLNGRTLNSVSIKNSINRKLSPASSGRVGGSFLPSSLLNRSKGGGSGVERPPNNRGVQMNNKKSGTNVDSPKRVLKREEKELLLKRLTPTQFRVTQEKVTERPYSNAYYRHWERGVYSCVVCGEPLFLSHTKYDSGSGWPAFYDIISWDRVTLKQDLSHVGANLLLLVCNPSLARTEVSCATCSSHIGHVFDDGPKPTGQRFCVNSTSLSFTSSEERGLTKERGLAVERQLEEEEEEKTDSEKEAGSRRSCGDTLAPLVHMASAGNSCSLGARLCFRIPATVDGGDGPASRT